MGIEIAEQFDSREWSGNDVTLRYKITGSADDDAVRTALLAGTPTSYNGMIRQPRPSLECVWADTVHGDGLWEARVVYSLPDQVEMDVGDVRIDWTTRGGSQHVTQALEHIQSYDSSGTVSLLEGAGAINFDGETVQGVDIPCPVFAFTVTKRFATGTAPSLATIYALTDHVNNAQFSVTDSITGETITLNAGECLFEGADKVGSGDDGSTEIAFSFEASPNKTNIAVGDITVAAKKGWEYLSVEHRDAVDTGRNVVTKSPAYAHVDRVFETGDFSGLAL
ncbi:MAG: hypothetical protein BWX88_05304 [Planctomycetes bacterium ADurb.Bin126]|nr:MAG: hypothetical protein BWX88_05304 [Planctomycetes bacterium ADurb.Bin126]HOD84617.1 hypothetical protein [Phycisphaerae bacterium]